MFSSKIAPKLGTAVRRATNSLTQTGVGTSGTPLSRPTVPGMPDSRRIHLMANGTKTDGRQVTDPGHIQYQYSSDEAARLEALTGEKPAEAIGHSPLPGQRGEIVRTNVTIDGQQVRVGSRRTDAIVSGDDKPIKQGPQTLDADLGELSDAQLRQMHALSKTKVFDSYETSGNDGANCVHAAAKIANKVLDTDIQMSPNATPQQAFAAIKDAVVSKEEV